MKTQRTSLKLSAQAGVGFLFLTFAVHSLAGPGGLDLTFDPASGVNGPVYCAVEQTDGKVIVGGSFSTVRGAARNGIARLNADGTVDRTFDPGMGATSTVASPPFNTNYTTTVGAVYSIALQPDGKVLIGGSFTAVNGASRKCIARLNANGSLDTSFDPGTGAGSTVYALLILTNGEVMVGGSFTNINGENLNCIARLHSDGSVDDSFNPVSMAGTVRSMAVQADGRLLLAGGFSSVNQNSRNGIARLNANGSLDTTFDPGSGAGGLSSLVSCVALQADGQVLVAGAFTSMDGTNRNRIARLNADGSLDTSFDPGSGAQSIGGVSSPVVASVVVQTDGKVVLGGNFASVNGTNRNGIARLNTDGSLDDTFDPGSGVSNQVFCVSLQSDGKVLVGGSFTNVNGVERYNLARLNSDGSPDETLDPGLRAAVPEDISCVALQPDGKVLLGVANYLVGYYEWPYPNTLVRLNPDGSLDRTFSIGSGLNEEVYCVAVQGDGRILIGGCFSRVNGTNRNGIARLNADGSLDTTFAPALGANTAVQCLALQEDGDVVLGGSIYPTNGAGGCEIARLKPDGSLDNSFTLDTVENGSVSSIVVQPDGGVLAGGSFTSVNGTARNKVARLTPDGTLDNSFDPGAGPDYDVLALAIQADGKVLVGGDFTAVDAASRRYIARLKPDGTLDDTFNPGPWAAVGYFSSSAYSIAVQWDGKVLVGGNFAATNGMTGNNLVRLNADGSLDLGFRPGALRVGAWSGGGYVYSIAVQPDGRVLIGGNFGTVGGVTRERVARLWGDGPTLVFGPVKENDDLVARFAGIPGVDYTIEYRANLSPDTWHKLTNIVAPTNDVGFGVGVFELRDPVQPSGERLYRVVYPTY